MTSFLSAAFVMTNTAPDALLGVWALLLAGNSALIANTAVHRRCDVFNMNCSLIRRLRQHRALENDGQSGGSPPPVLGCAVMGAFRRKKVSSRRKKIKGGCGFSEAPWQRLRGPRNAGWLVQ